MDMGINEAGLSKRKLLQVGSDSPNINEMVENITNESIIKINK